MRGGLTPRAAQWDLSSENMTSHCNEQKMGTRPSDQASGCIAGRLIVPSLGTTNPQQTPWSA